MNRLIFNEGGQPVFLDDLKLLQENDTGFNHRLLEAITGSRQTFLLEQIEGKPVSVDQEKMTTTFDDRRRWRVSRLPSNADNG